jgi:deoxyhypusine synthase
MKSGIEYMTYLADWYTKNSAGKGVGFFQIGGGIAGDFPICVVCCIRIWKCMTFLSGLISARFLTLQHLMVHIPELFRMRKITWGKLDITTPNLSLKVMLRSVHH